MIAEPNAILVYKSEWDALHAEIDELRALLREARVEHRFHYPDTLPDKAFIARVDEVLARPEHYSW
jgi:hypothetical protein